MRPRILDLFCGAGGAATGYHRAGFDVVGVDLAPQPNYPFEFHRENALERIVIQTGTWRKYDAIHASPPCQAFSAYRRKGHGVGDGYPDLIANVRELCLITELPFVIENVPGAPLDPDKTVWLEGSSFGLDVKRRRGFECHGFDPHPIPTPTKWQTPRFPAATNRAPMSRRTVEVGVWRIPLEVQQRAMGIDWMTREELSEAIPPAYTEFIGRRLHAALEQKEAA